MNAKLNTPNPERIHTRPVSYIWTTPDGAVHHGSTVLISKTRHGLRQALKRFFITNNHVSPETV